MITFSNQQYVNSHGKAPRGRGGWGFLVSRKQFELVKAYQQKAPARSLPVSFFENGPEHVIFITGPSRTLGESKKVYLNILANSAPKGADFWVEVAP